MIDVQNKMGVKNVPQVVRSELCGIYEKKDLTQKEKKKHIKSEYQSTKLSTDNKKIDMLKMISWKK